MTPAERIELSARFLEATSYPDVGVATSLVPDLTAEHELGRVVRLVRERWPDGSWRIALIRAGVNEYHEAVIWPDWGGSEAHESDGKSANVALMHAAIAAAEAEDA